MSWEMETEDAAGRPLLIALERGLDPDYPNCLDLYVRHQESWEIVNMVQLAEIEQDGSYLNDDGSLTLDFSRPDREEDRWIDQFVVRLEPTVVSSVVAWAQDCLKLKPHNRGRFSALAERAS